MTPFDCSNYSFWSLEFCNKDFSLFLCQIENAMFLKQLKDQEKNTLFPSSHYQTTVLTVPKQDGEGQGGHLHPPHTQNITVVPVPSTGIMTAGVCVNC